MSSTVGDMIINGFMTIMLIGALFFVYVVVTLVVSSIIQIIKYKKNKDLYRGEYKDLCFGAWVIGGIMWAVVIVLIVIL